MDDNDVLMCQFLKVLKNKEIKSVFQPIVSLRDGSVFGYEVLSRGPENTEMHNPCTLFDYAKKLNKLWDLECLCRVTAIETVYNIKLQTKIFLNVNPRVINDIKFKQGFTKEYLSQYDIDPENIIFEITERGVISNFADFMHTIDNYKEQNFKIAIDDAGAGYSGLNMITDINPHFIKLDMHLIRDIDKDFTRQSLIKSFTEFASLTNTALIAEGIETKAELLKLIDLGVHYGQGFFLQRPCDTLCPLNEEVLRIIADANMKRNHLTGKKFNDLFICNISTELLTVNPHLLTAQVLNIMEKDLSLPGLCVTDNGLVRGVITRNELYKRLSGQYGYTLYANKPISHIMAKKFLQVDYHDSIDTVSKKAMSRGYENLYDFITVVKDGKYYGIVTVKDLLEKSYQVELYNAIHLNPLSELPGNVMIENELEKCLNSSFEYYIMYFDINNFKAYNDVYGFENGDKFLKRFTMILKNNIPQESNFLGHIGGDDFIAIVSLTDIEKLCKKIIEDFDEAALLFYNKNDLERGYITTKNRHGVEEAFPILSLSIAVTPNKQYDSVFYMTEKMAGLKKYCKLKPGSTYIIG